MYQNDKIASITTSTNHCRSVQDCDVMSQVIYQTRETVFHRDIQTPRKGLEIQLS